MKSRIAIVFLAVLAGGLLGAAEPPAEFSTALWSRVEKKSLLTDKKYSELLKNYISASGDLEFWRNRRLDSPDMRILTGELMTAAALERELAVSGADSRKLREQERKCDAIRAQIDDLWSRDTALPEYAKLSSAASDAAAKLYDRAVWLLRRARGRDAAEALRMLLATKSIAIPSTLQIASDDAAVPAMPLDDAGLYAGYEQRLLAKDPGYALLKSQCDVAFNILSQWQELQLSSTPEGRKVLDDFNAASGKVVKLAGDATVPQAELLNAKSELDRASAELKRVQYYVFRSDRQNRILTDSYYKTRAKMLKRGVELLEGAKGDAAAQALAGRIRTLQEKSSPESSGVLGAETAAAPVVEAGLEGWENKFFAGDGEFLRLKSEYASARLALKTYQHDRIKCSAEGAVLLDEITGMETEIKEKRAAAAPDGEIEKLIVERNLSVQALGRLYQSEIAGDIVNITLQKKLADSRAALYDYTVGKLKASADPEAAAILAKMNGKTEK
ncbi:MAG: hypothetical protein PHI85_01945 [Victivallaceae bacterium]|nr:hypothetical protein [Victivallaceae bacterium]